MRVACKPIAVGLFVLFVCWPALAYQLAMKNGTVVQFQKYRVEIGKVIYMDADGKEVSVAIADVDMERTTALNAKETPPLDLSGASTKPAGASGTSQAAGTSDESSLGDVARNLRAQGKAQPPSQKRTFTNDDVRSAPSGGTPAGNSSAGDKKASGNPGAEKTKESEAEEDQELTEQDLSEFYDLDREDLGRAVMRYYKLPDDTPFPDRAEWEFRLYDAKQDWVHAYMNQKAHPQDEQALAELRQSDQRFDKIIEEGKERAVRYLQTHPK